MSEDKSSQLFRKRVEVGSDSGLATVPRPKRPEGLTISPESFDLKKEIFDDFADVTPVKPGTVEVEKNKEGFTDDQIDLGALDHALQNIRSQQTDQAILELTEEARRLIEAGNFSGALEVLDEARTIAPTDGTIFYLIGLCHFALGNFHAGYEHLSAAVDHATDPDTLAAAATFRGACLRVIVDEIATQLTQLKKKGRSKEALALVDENLRLYPSSVTLLYQRCELLLRLRLAEQAREAAQDGIERGGEENAPLFRRMLEQATLLEYQSLLEPVRQALRADDVPKAMKHLKSAQSTLKGHQFYEGVYTYAREKRPPSGMLSIFSRSREPTVSLSSEQLQKLLRWLLSEELDAAHDFFDRAEYAASIGQLKKASYIDSRCTHVNYLHGLSLYRVFLERLNDKNQGIDLEQSAKDLKAAVGYVQEAAADPSLVDRSRELGAAISAYLEQVNQILREFQRRANEARAIVDLLNKYNSYMDRLEKNGVSTIANWNTAREQMLLMKQQGAKLSSSCSDDEGRELLKQLAHALDSNLQSLEKIKDEIGKYSLVHECLNDYQKMIEGFRRNPISTMYALEMAKVEVRVLLDKVARARTALGYNAAADVRKPAITNYVKNWKPGAELSLGLVRTKPANVNEQMWDLLIKLETALLDNQRMLENPRRY